MDRSISVNASQRRYEIVIEGGLLSKIGHFIASKMNATKTVTVSDENVWDFHGESLLNGLKTAGIETHPIILEPGEISKNPETVSAIYDHLIDIHANRSTPMLAFGGGVVGDTAGFAASTYMRGIPLFQVPTSLLAQVDSSIGGKVGVNHPEAKNLIGSFYQPETVLIDPELLRTLPDKEMRNGLSEVIKYALISSGDLLDFLSQRIETILRQDLDPLEYVISECCAFKSAIVEKDEFDEKDIRAFLNYGHTVGHAIEAAGGFDRFTHGEAIAIGMTCAARICQSYGYLSTDEVDLHIDLINRAGLPAKVPPDISLDSIEQALALDKKATDKGLTFVLLKGLGEPFLDKNVPIEVVRRSISSLTGG